MPRDLQAEHPSAHEDQQHRHGAAGSAGTGEITNSHCSSCFDIDAWVVVVKYLLLRARIFFNSGRAVRGTRWSMLSARVRRFGAKGGLKILSLKSVMRPRGTIRPYTHAYYTSPAHARHHARA